MMMNSVAFREECQCCEGAVKKNGVLPMSRVLFIPPSGRCSSWNFNATTIIKPYIVLHSTAIGLLYDSGFVSSYPNAILSVMAANFGHVVESCSNLLHRTN